MRPRGVVFDLEGTLVDNMGLHAEAWADFMRRHELAPLARDVAAGLQGKRNRDILPVLFGHEIGDEERHRLCEEKETLYRRRSRRRLRPLPGLLRLLGLLEEQRVPVAIATSAPAENVRHTLEELNLDGRLAQIARSDEVERGKPHFDVFLAAAVMVGVGPAHCLAFEDSPMGVAAARAAGMRCVAVNAHFAPAAFSAREAEPEAFVADYEEYLPGPGSWLRRSEAG